MLVDEEMEASVVQRNVIISVYDGSGTVKSDNNVMSMSVGTHHLTIAICPLHMRAQSGWYLLMDGQVVASS